MVLKNKKGQERNFNLLYKLELNAKTYFIYEDIITKKCYAGLQEGQELNVVSKEEIDLLERIIKRVNEE